MTEQVTVYNTTPEEIANIVVNKLIGLIPAIQPTGNNEQPKDDKPEYMTVQEAADFLKISVSTLRRFTRDDKIKSFKIPKGRKVMYKTIDVRSFVQEKNFAA